MHKKSFLFAAAVLFSSVSLSNAADMVETVPYDGGEIMPAPVEVGSGWYLRGDINYAVSSKVRGTERKYKVEGKPWNEPYTDKTWNHVLGLKNQLGASVGVGYQFTDNLRGDITAGYSNQRFKDVDAKVRTWDVMANAYYDVGNFNGVTPYLGAGIGFANVKYKGVLGDGNTFSSDAEYRFAWALMAGVAIDVASNVKIDLGYRYSEINGGEIYAPKGYTLSDKSLRSHQLRAGVRLSTW